MCVCTFPFFAHRNRVAALLLDRSADLCCSCPIIELNSALICLSATSPASWFPHIPNLSFFKELSSSNCLILSSHPASSAHSPCLLRVLSFPPPNLHLHLQQQIPALESSCLPEWAFQNFYYFLPLYSFPLCPALINAKCGLGSSTTSWEKLPPSQTISHLSLLYHFSRHFLSSSSY